MDTETALPEDVQTFIEGLQKAWPYMSREMRAGFFKILAETQGDFFAKCATYSAWFCKSMKDVYVPITRELAALPDEERKNHWYNQMFP